MRRRRLYTFILAHEANAPIRKLSIPHSMLYVIGVFCLLGIVSTVSAVYEYSAMALKVVSFNRLREENKTIKIENQKFQLLSNQLAEKVASLEVASMKVSVLSGLESADPKAGIGGVGGLTRSLTPSKPVSSLDGPGMAAYQKNLATLEGRYRELQNYYAGKALRSTFTPNIWPVKGYLTGGFGTRSDPFSSQREYHAGIDISAPYGNRIVAPADGVVIFCGPREDYGNVIVIDHKFGTTTRYGHLSKIVVRVGQKVSRGDYIGNVGMTGRTTGSHLHYEVRIFDRPISPIPYLKSYQKIG
jgi:murein DD-endopeptidase MepM/ murein hydrolase activator NlpD